MLLASIPGPFSHSLQSLRALVNCLLDETPKALSESSLDYPSLLVPRQFVYLPVLLTVCREILTKYAARVLDSFPALLGPRWIGEGAWPGLWCRFVDPSLYDVDQVVNCVVDLSGCCYLWRGQAWEIVSHKHVEFLSVYGLPKPSSLRPRRLCMCVYVDQYTDRQVI